MTPDDLAGVHDSVECVSGVGLVADAPQREWKLSDFSVFNEVQKPIVVVSPGLYQKPSRWREFSIFPFAGVVRSLTDPCILQMGQIEGLTACDLPELGVSKTFRHPQV